MRLKSPIGDPVLCTAALYSTTSILTALVSFSVLHYPYFTLLDYLTSILNSTLLLHYYTSLLSSYFTTFPLLFTVWLINAFYLTALNMPLPALHYFTLSTGHILHMEGKSQGCGDLHFLLRNPQCPEFDGGQLQGGCLYTFASTPAENAVGFKCVYQW